MLQSILDKYYQFAPWEQENPRFMRLRYLEKWLDGDFYNPIGVPFSQERGAGGKYIPITERRPAVQQNQPQHIADLCARKLFGGKHAPRLRHKDEKVKQTMQAFVDETKLVSKMLEAVRKGSIGSVLVRFQFRVLEQETETGPAQRVQNRVEILPARAVTPIFDSFEDLQEVRIHYPVPGSSFLSSNFVNDAEGEPINPRNKYWYIRHLTLEEDCIYFPVLESKWNPVHGYTEKRMTKLLVPNMQQENILGFIPAIWIRNMPGGVFPDGKCTFEAGLNNFIEYDYMLSQIGRGLFYHASPQLVIKGKVEADEDDPGLGRGLSYGASTAINLPADYRDTTGGETGHDAKLLDTNAQGLKTGVEFATSLKHTTMEQLSAARKDLESINGSMSGKAMELIDQDFLDLIEELRIQYSENGYLVLIKKMAKAAKLLGHPLVANLSDVQIDGLSLQYPAYYTPDPQEFLYLVQALTLATGQGQKNPEGGVNASAAPAPVKDPLLTPQEARQYLMTMMDFALDSEDKPVVEETEPTKPHEDLLEPSPDDQSLVSDTDLQDLEEQQPQASDKKTPEINVPF